MGSGVFTARPEQVTGLVLATYHFCKQEFGIHGKMDLQKLVTQIPKLAQVGTVLGKRQYGSENQ